MPTKPTAQAPKGLVCMAPFKGSLSNSQACDAVGAALKELGIAHELCPIGDGGRGSLDAVATAKGGELVPLKATGPMGAPTEARVLAYPDAVAPQWVYLESAETCGIHLVPSSGLEAMRASSNGLGQLIQQVIQKWGKSLTTVYLGLGDTAVSDMGMGLLCGLGLQFTDASGHILWGNADGLRHIRSIKLPDVSALDRIRFVVLCDVLNPLVGPKGSARVFSKQKGATATQISLIEQGMENFATQIQSLSGRNLREVPMGGAAGGIAAACHAFLNTELVLGARFLLDWIGFDQKVADKSFLITGEGCTDQQTVNGKAPYVCLERAEALKKHSLLISGRLEGNYTQIQHFSSLRGFFECGDQPSAHEALYKKTLEVLSVPALREDLA